MITTPLFKYRPHRGISFIPNAYDTSVSYAPFNPTNNEKHIIFMVVVARPTPAKSVGSPILPTKMRFYCQISNCRIAFTIAGPAICK